MVLGKHALLLYQNQCGLTFTKETAQKTGCIFISKMLERLILIRVLPLLLKPGDKF